MKSKEDILKANTKAQRNLDLQSLKEWNTDEELEALLPKQTYMQPNYLADEKYNAQFERFKDDLKKAQPKRRFIWSPEEDKFLTASYMYISDATIALALNMPVHEVTKRRDILKLKKGHTIPIEVLVWCNREDFERDMEKYPLTRARPELYHATAKPRVEDE